MDPTTIDDARELLYGYPAESFVAERDMLVKATRAGGDRDLANQIKQLRKPSAIAALVNQVVRLDPDGVELILQAAALLRTAQAGALEGTGVNAFELQQQYRAAVGAMAQSAPSRRAEVRAALEAATIDESSNQDLRTGCLVVVPTPVSIFGTLPDAPTPQPVDELQERRAQRQAKKATAKATATKKAAAQAAAAQAAAEQAAAEQAERQRKAAEKELRKQRAALQKQHREALRAHLGALDAEAAAGQALEQAELQITDLNAAIAEAEARVAELATEHERAMNDVAKRAQARADAQQHIDATEAAADELAKRLAALDHPGEH